jgi:hypothetical protein
MKYFDDNTIITASVFDNGNIYHPIPQSDVGYRWINISLAEKGLHLSQSLIISGGYNLIYGGYSYDSSSLYKPMEEGFTMNS